MDKPTVFFSHSSKDKSTILPIKDKLCSITANVLDVFMSSDGQSIPFGNNWIHKVEEGLNKAQIMFVFVTPISVNSAWIYFEAGFAYSKNIEVIPVGIGISVGQLNPPLSLLQGFDITSTDSLNNFISIINKKFDLKFDFAFSDDTYNAVFATITNYAYHINIGEMFNGANITISSQYSILNSDEIIRYDIDAWATNIKEHLKNNSIKFVSYRNSIITGGISVDIVGTEREPSKNAPYQNHKIIFKLSTQNFEQTFALYKEMVLNCLTGYNCITLSFNLSKLYSCLQSNVDISSIVAANNNDFDYIDNNINFYRFGNNINFRICKVFNERERKYEDDSWCVWVSFKVSENVEYGEIISLFEEMLRCGLLFKH